MTVDAVKELIQDVSNLSNIDEITKVNMLESTVLSGTPQDVRAVIDFCGEFEFTARALALACRYAGLETVKILVDAGYTFDYEYSEHLQELYAVRHCYYEGIQSKKDACFWYFIVLDNLNDEIKLGDLHRMPKTDRAPLSEDVRAETVAYLSDKNVLTQDMCNIIYYYSILLKLPSITEVLEERGSRLSDDIINDLTQSKHFVGFRKDFNDCFLGNKYGVLKLAELLVKENKKLRITSVIPLDDFYRDRLAMEKLLEYADLSSVGKKKLLINAVDCDGVDVVDLLLEMDYAKLPKTRESVLEYAVQKGKTEIAALILKYKKTKVDIQKEEENKAKREMRELTASTDSVTVLSKIWSTKKLDDGTLMITSYKGSAEEITVPAKMGKSPVTVIGEYTFSRYAKRLKDSQKKSRENLQSVVIPEGITRIEPAAFFGCCSLINIDLPNSLISIGHDAFRGCDSLVSITVPDGISLIDYRTFNMCRSLENVVFPKSLKEIDLEAFSGCKSLKKLSIPDGTEKIAVRAFEGCKQLENIELPDSIVKIGNAFGDYNDFIFNKSKTVLWHFYNSENRESYTVPDNITKIGDYAFAGYNKKPLKSIVIPDSVTEIGDWAFSGCSELVSVKIGSGVTKIGRSVFNNCEKLEEIILPEGITKIEKYIFNHCNIKKIILPKNIIEIDEGAFRNCILLEAVEIPNTVTEIGEYAFGECFSLKEITIPENVGKIGKHAFIHCTELAKITLLNGKTKLYKDTFYGCNNFTVCAPENSSVEKFARRNNFSFQAL